MTPDVAAARALVRRPGLARLLAALDRDGEETRIVGGAIRNALLGRPVHEVDLATTGLPSVTTARAAAAGLRTVPTGIAHGTVTVLVEGTPFEVTTLRQDVETDGRHAVVRFGRDFAADAARRDFTMNALSLDRDGTVRDYTDGLADLAAGRVRFIGEAESRIREDYLRILRFFRFSAEYGRGALDRAGLLAAIAGRDGLALLSRERVGSEVLKLVAARRGPEVAAVFAAAGLLGRVVPAVGEAGRLARAAAQDADPPDAVRPDAVRPNGVRRLAAFLVRIPEDADRLRDAFRLSNGQGARLAAYGAALARILSRDAPIDAAEARRLVVLHGPEAVGDVLAATAGEPRPRLAPDGRAALDRLLAGRDPVPRMRLTGAALVRSGLPPGPEIGRRLDAARSAWIAAGCPDESSTGETRP